MDRGNMALARLIETHTHSFSSAGALDPITLANHLCRLASPTGNLYWAESSLFEAAWPRFSFPARACGGRRLGASPQPCSFESGRFAMRRRPILLRKQSWIRHRPVG